jgi:hypothetical protein
MTSWKAAASAATVAAVVMVAPLAAAKEARGNQTLRRGEYLVSFGGCHDCHTPWKMGPTGPAPDMTRQLSGHPQGMTLPPAPRLPPGPWMASVTATMTAWAGPWGVSFTPNLTPDPETGMGKWTEQNFIEAMRTGRHMGRGRPILPPMPFYALARLTDADLKAVFAYLRSIPPIKNRVPEPLPPAAAAAGGGSGSGGEGSAGGAAASGSQLGK